MRIKELIIEIVEGAIIGLIVTGIFIGAVKIKAAGADTYLSKEIQMYCEEIGEMYCVQPELLEAIIETESSGNPNAKNDDCIGLMQISPRWHKVRAEHLKVYDLYDAYGNILVGTDYLMELAAEYGDLPTVLAVYNGDSRALEEGYVSEYATKIMERSAELERVHKK